MTAKNFIRLQKGLKISKRAASVALNVTDFALKKQQKPPKRTVLITSLPRSISPHKNAQVLNQIGLELEESYSVKYLCSDFKKKNGYKRSCELSEIYGLYRQNYCGCIYSKLEADERERAKNNNEQPLSVQ